MAKNPLEINLLGRRIVLKSGGDPELAAEVVKIVSDRINQAEYLLVRAEMHTTNQGASPVKFAVADKLQVSIGLRAKVQYKLN